MAIYVGYQDAKSCTGGPTNGARALMAWFLAAYPNGRNLGIYNCRSVRGGSTTSLHGEGRAADLGIGKPTKKWKKLSNLLRLHSRELGVQCIIYNRRIWSGAYPHAGWRRYDGLNPHRDHLHVELGWAAARNLTAAKLRTILGGETSGGTDDAGGGQGSTATPKAPAFPLPRGHYFGPSAGRRSHGGHGPRRDDLRRWQQRMRDRGWTITADGLYGPQTADVARKFQREKRLAVDGLIGPVTWAAAWTKPIT